MTELRADAGDPTVETFQRWEDDPDEVWFHVRLPWNEGTVEGEATVVADYFERLAKRLRIEAASLASGGDDE